MLLDYICFGGLSVLFVFGGCLNIATMGSHYERGWKINLISRLLFTPPSLLPPAPLLGV